MTEYPSKLVENAVNEFSRLPGIGRKTALRLVLHLLKQEVSEVERFSQAFDVLRKNIQYCSHCHNISDTPVCAICANTNRDDSILCVVEDTRDMMAIESTSQFRGKYHILGGIISPMDGIGPKELNIESLVNKVNTGIIKEIILALKTTMEGETTNFYIYRKLKDSGVKISQIARGIAIGDELEYTDEVTLGRSIINRVPLDSTFAK